MIERLKYLRKNILKLKQKNFAAIINLKPNSYSPVENGIRNLTERNIKTICEKFNVNEDWLRNGDEPIFIETNNDNLFNILQKEYNLEPAYINLIKGLLEIDEHSRNIILNIISSLANIINEAGQEALTSNIPNLNEDGLMEFEPKMAEYYNNLEVDPKDVDYALNTSFEDKIKDLVEEAKEEDVEFHAAFGGGANKITKKKKK